MKVPIFDLTDQYIEMRQALLAALDDVMATGHFILGQQVKLLEGEIAQLAGVAHGAGVANGSDALHLALMACGVGPGDEVIVPAFTFFATAGAVVRAGATPVFVDVDPDTFMIGREQIEAALSPRTRAVIPVHLYGQMAPVEEMLAVCSDRGVRIIEDAAQAIGASRYGRNACSIGDAGTLSFFPTKNLGAYGDAGMVLTGDDELAARVRLLRVHGSKVKYYHEELGYNSRLDELQAAILRVKLGRLQHWTHTRQSLAARYDRLIHEAGLSDSVSCPVVAKGNVHVYHQYTIRTIERDRLKDALLAAGIETSIYYPLPLHLQPVFRELGYRAGQLPISERLSQQALSLPMFPELKPEQQEYVVDVIAKHYV